MSTATAIKERPIIFSGPMVLALLEGRKTQTRRIVKPQPQESFSQDYGPDGEPTKRREYGFLWIPRDNGAWYSVENDRMCLACPYGQPGDRLWVRETFVPLKAPGVSCPIREATYVCFMDGSQKFRSNGNYYPYDIPSPPNWRADLKVRPSIHMPRWASRITLEITEVRVEKLASINEADAIAEGARRFDHLPRPAAHRNFETLTRWSMEDPTSSDQCMGTARLAFGNYWMKLNGDDSGYWPDVWVWALSFRRVEVKP